MQMVNAMNQCAFGRIPISPPSYQLDEFVSKDSSEFLFFKERKKEK